MARRLPAKEQVVKLIVGAGQASPSPPVGPALGSKGVKSMDFCKVRLWVDSRGELEDTNALDRNSTLELHISRLEHQRPPESLFALTAHSTSTCEPPLLPGC